MIKFLLYPFMSLYSLFKNGGMGDKWLSILMAAALPLLAFAVSIVVLDAWRDSQPLTGVVVDKYIEDAHTRFTGKVTVYIPDRCFLRVELESGEWISRFVTPQGFNNFDVGDSVTFK